ncbi:MAG: hypothetical protein DMF33_13190 [Verrucomicrobia bacterium]|nr:MAG: hypothetical protein DMF33_13190 [Verrucomicrobiota bacterium]
MLISCSSLRGVHASSVPRFGILPNESPWSRRIVGIAKSRMLFAARWKRALPATRLLIPLKLC